MTIMFRVDGFEVWPESGVPTYWEMPVLKETPKGVWVAPFPGTKRFILLGATKQFAWATKKEALESFIWRKRKQVKILQEKLFQAQELLMMAEEAQQKGR